MAGKLRPKSGLDLWEVQNCYGWGNCGSRPPPDSILSRRMVSQWGCPGHTLLSQTKNFGLRLIDIAMPGSVFGNLVLGGVFGNGSN